MKMNIHPLKLQYYCYSTIIKNFDRINNQNIPSLLRKKIRRYYIDRIQCRCKEYYLACILCRLIKNYYIRINLFKDSEWQ